VGIFRTEVILSVLALGLLPLQAAACNIPVFRYALERWACDRYEVTAFHRGPLAAQDRRLVDGLRKSCEADHAGANCSVTVVDVAEPVRGPLRGVWQAQATRPLPWVVVRYPAGEEEHPPAWVGSLTEAVAANLLDSPARRELVRRLLRGDAIVWVLLEGGQKPADEAAARLVQAESARLEKTLKLPDGVAEDTVPLLSDLPVGTRSSLLRVSRADPAEKLFAALLLGTDKELAGGKEPAVFPVFGRGRVLTGLAGTDLNAEALQNTAEFLCGACSCLVKRLNLGTDLLVTADWDSVLRDRGDRAPAAEGETVPIPHGRPEGASQVLEETVVDPEVPPAASRRRPSKMTMAAAALAGLSVVVTGAIALRSRRRKPPTNRAGSSA
jgi:hypothetical protein